MIEFENAGFSYGGAPVLRDATFTLAPGSFQFLLAPSGAGKTTAVRLACLDLAPTAGRIRFFGRSIAGRDRNAIADLRRAVGVVPQRCRFLDHLPLIENIALPLEVSGATTADRGEDLRALLEWVELADRAGARPPQLSGGERRRAALARAVIQSPEVILADEPTDGLDWESAHGLMMLLVELNRMGKAVLVATHDPNLVRAARARVPARVLHIAGGRVEPAEAEP